jgi:hypothetical protein
MKRRRRSARDGLCAPVRRTDLRDSAIYDVDQVPTCTVTVVRVSSSIDGLLAGNNRIGSGRRCGYGLQEAQMVSECHSTNCGRTTLQKCSSRDLHACAPLHLGFTSLRRPRIRRNRPQSSLLVLLSLPLCPTVFIASGNNFRSSRAVGPMSHAQVNSTITSTPV